MGRFITGDGVTNLVSTAQLDARMAAEVAQVHQEVNKRILMPPNLIQNSYFTRFKPTRVASVGIVASASDYTSPPAVVFSAREGEVAATGIAQLSGGKVVGVTLTSPGSNYTSAPDVAFVGGGGSGCLGVAFMENGEPEGFAGGGVTIELVSPYTKGFEGVYTQARPDYALTSDRVEEATALQPVWYGPHYKGPRLSRGGLADGWATAGKGHILKITAPARTPNYATLDMKAVTFPPAVYAATDRLRFRAFVKLVKGSELGIGVDAGLYSVAAEKATYTTHKKVDLDQGPEGWSLIDTIVLTSQVTVPLTLNVCLGFNTAEETEAYIALPYAAIPYSAVPGMVTAEAL